MDASGISSYDKGKHKKEAFAMRKDTETLKHDAEVAQFRFALIAPVIQGLFLMPRLRLTTNVLLLLH